jgi:hypothetical protein
MIWIVIAIQLTLSAGLLWAAWQVWMFKKALIATVKTVDGWTKACQNGLQVSSPSLDIAGSVSKAANAIGKNSEIIVCAWTWCILFRESLAKVW